MNRKLMLMTVAIIATATAQAQYVTYNHDSPKQNQITVMETRCGLPHAGTVLLGITQQIQEIGSGKEQTGVPHDSRHQPL